MSIIFLLLVIRFWVAFLNSPKSEPSRVISEPPLRCRLPHRIETPFILFRGGSLAKVMASLSFTDLPEDLQVEIVSYLTLPDVFVCVLS
jgi:hypothetical protein